MKLFRFYFYTFLRYYSKKGEAWAPRFRSLLLTELTVFFLILFVCLLIDPNFIKSTSGAIRFFNILFNICILYGLYKMLVSGGKSEQIVSEFQDSAINTKRNRIICWIIFVVSLLAPMCVAVINKDYIILT